jgi:hypothetical protein
LTIAIISIILIFASSRWSGGVWFLIALRYNYKKEIYNKWN